MKWAKSTASLLAHHPHVSSSSSTSTSTATPTDVTSLWSSLLNATSVTGRQLFDQDMRSSASAAINELRKSKGISPKLHVGMLRTRLKELWEELDDLAKEDWQRKAREIKESMDSDVLSRYCNFYSDASYTILTMGQYVEIKPSSIRMFQCYSVV